MGGIAVTGTAALKLSGGFPSPLSMTALIHRKTYAEWKLQLDTMHAPTPFLVLDPAEALSNVRRLQRLLPRLDIHYAVKSNRDERLIAAIDAEIAGYEIASLGECLHLLGQGIAPERILFSNPVKVPRHIEETYSLGVRWYSFDAIDEVHKIAQYAPRSQVYVRLKVTDVGSQFPLSKKFGLDIKQAVACMLQAKLCGLQPAGITFHVGSQSTNPLAWTQAFEKCGRLIRMLRSEGIRISVVNIGGGLPASYAIGPIAYEPITAAIQAAIQHHIPPHVRIVAEPGRAISASAGIIVASVIGRVKRGAAEEWLFIDVGAFHGLVEPTQVSGWKYPVLTEYKSFSQTTSFTLTGPTCDPGDTLGDGYVLPAGLHTGDRLYIGATGAYTSVYGTTFNGFETLPTYYINPA